MNTTTDIPNFRTPAELAAKAEPSDYAAEIARLEAHLHQCAHQRQRVTRRRLSNGTVQVWGQCLDCGSALGARRKTDYNLDSLPWWDASLPRRREELQLKLTDLRVAQWQAERAAESDAFQRVYAEYLRSEDWQRLKRRALTRDNFRCQHCGCEVNPRTSNPHHILPWGYETLRQHGYSMLFEVVTLCRRCHALAHGRQE